MDRKLTTIFASDVVGFSKMMGTDEVNTLKILKERREAIDAIIDEHDGIIFGSAGDSVIAEFTSPIKASEAAIAIQSHVALEQMEEARKKELEFMDLVSEISSELELTSLLSKIIVVALISFFPIVVNLVSIVSIYIAVLSPGLIPGIKPPYFLRFSAVSLGLKVIDV